ncbi:sugar carrier protein C-like [Dorcoceras hygrometricum]|uniref:Sugar carrier protein C-like n=1 Tax=Dorcoceras hygrometricum TaxID=472368 RepID=A0A2Z7CE20_9LAMI|nr:sugar carrier protein C-like [Dorcoceras hygrometricum]
MGGPGISTGSSKAYPGKLTAKVLLTCLVGATGGLIFGYDIGISGGVTSMPSFLQKFFPDVYKREELNIGSTNQYCKFNDRVLTLFTSSLYLAALLASTVASKVTRTCGRRLSMLAGGVLFLAGAVVNGFAYNRIMLIVGRVLLGFGIGFANQSAPLYLSEMAPYKYRGALNICFQLSITIGILAAYGLNYFTASNENGWRISLGAAAVPALIFIVGSLCLPDTPNSLIERDRVEEAKTRLRAIRGIHDVDEEFNDLMAASIQSKKIKHPWLNLCRRKYRPQLVFVTLIPFFQQFTGMNVFMFYSPVLFKTIGFGNNASLFSSVITGVVNSLATFVSICFADSFGRRALFIEGGIQMLTCQTFITAFIGWKYRWDGNPGVLPHWYAWSVVIAICIYIAAFAWSWGPLGWLVPSEILPLEVRSAGQSINVCVNMACTFIIAQIFTWMLCHFRFLMFVFFAFFVLVMTIFIKKYLPETKGIPIEEMADIWKAHPVWSKYVTDDGEDTKQGSKVEMAAESITVVKDLP